MVLSGLQLHLSRAPRRVLRTFCHQLADPRGPEALPPKCLPHLHVGAEHHLQPKDFPLGRARHGSVRGGEGERQLCLCFSRLRSLPPARCLTVRARCTTFLACPYIVARDELPPPRLGGGRGPALKHRPLGPALHEPRSDLGTPGRHNRAEGK